MKKIQITLLSILTVFALVSCGDSTEKKADCDANNAASAAKCLCELMAIEDAISDNEEMSDEDYDKAFDKAAADTDAMNQKIDEAIDAGKYTEDILSDEAEKIGCEF